MREALTARITDPTAQVTITQRPSTAQTLLERAIVGLMAFLTVVDLFATQAILPSLTAHYRVSPATMGLAVNASTFGMAAAGLGVALFSARLDRRRGIVTSLVLLALPTALLAVAPDVGTFAALRVVQGVLMATAFTLTLAHLGETAPMQGGASGAIAAYITGNVASNLFGRLLSASAADSLGLGPSFVVFAALNLLGALLAHATLSSRARMKPAAVAGGQGMQQTNMKQMAAWTQHLRNPGLRATFAIGFCILFAFIGTFTYVNFVLAAAPLSLSMMQIGLVYLVFLPSIITTPLAGRLGSLLGPRRALLTGFGIALAGLPLLLAPHLAAVLAGLALIGIGTFLAQAVATGLIGRLAPVDPGSAGGLYLGSYFLGGLVGSAVLGQVFANFGWPATVAGFAAALLLASALSWNAVPTIRGAQDAARGASTIRR